MAKTAGRQIEIGIGIETTPGTSVAAADYVKWESLSLVGMSDKATLNSARGIRNKLSNSIIIKQYGKGAIEFAPTTDILPYFLGLALGSRSSGTASGESAVYNHTFTVQNANASMKTASLTIKQGSIQTEQYTNTVVDSIEFTVNKDISKCKVNLLGQFPTIVTAISPSYTQDSLFTRNQMLAYFGASVSAALGTAASTTLTSDTTAPANNSTIVIGGQTYTYKTSLTGAAYEVFINSTAAAALVNLKKAINGTGTAGTDYGVGTLPHTQVIATTVTTTTLLIVAIQNGTPSNSIATTQAGTSHCTWAGATMNSGTPGTGAGPSQLVDLSFTHSNNVLFEDAFLSGSASPAAGGFIAGPVSIKGSYTLQMSDTVELAKYQQNTLQNLVVVLNGSLLGVVPTYEQIVFKFGDLVLTKAPLEYKIDDITFLKQEFEIQYDATDKEITAIVTNTYAGTNYQ